MTKVVEVNCDKVWLVVKISLWILASIAISYITWQGYNFAVNGFDYKSSMCDIDSKNSFCFTIHHSPIYEILMIGLLLDLIDSVFFWLVINNKYKIIELRCKN